MLRTLTICAVLATACTTSAAPPIPEAYAGQSFRPIGELHFLPESVPVVLREAALVPDSKIEWDARVIAKNLGLGGVEVAVGKQVVTLDGVVPTDEARKTLVDAVEKIHGVSGVRDDLQVRP